MQMSVSVVKMFPCPNQTEETCRFHWSYSLCVYVKAASASAPIQLSLYSCSMDRPGAAKNWYHVLIHHFIFWMLTSAILPTKYLALKVPTVPVSTAAQCLLRTDNNILSFTLLSVAHICHPNPCFFCPVCLLMLGGQACLYVSASISVDCLQCSLNAIQSCCRSWSSLCWLTSPYCYEALMRDWPHYSHAFFLFKAGHHGFSLHWVSSSLIVIMKPRPY